MICGRNFNFLHVMKTGGTWAARASDALPKHLILSKKAHRPYSDLPYEQAKLPTYAAMRNPWDWYVSFYNFVNWKIRNRRQEYAKPKLPPFCIGEKALFSKPFNEALLSHPEELQFFRKLGVFTDHLTKREDGLHEHIRWLKFEDGVNENFLRILRETHGAIPGNSEAKIKNMAPINKVAHEHYSKYYTPETRDLVASWESDIIEKFDYEF